MASAFLFLDWHQDPVIIGLEAFLSTLFISFYLPLVNQALISFYKSFQNYHRFLSKHMGFSGIIEQKLFWFLYQNSPFYFGHRQLMRS
jgi:hypothetical protein